MKKNDYSLSVLIILLLMLCTSCVSNDAKRTLPIREYGLFGKNSNELIKVSTGNGDLTIKVTSPRGRLYSFNECKVNVKLIARNQQWQSRDGLYNPDARFSECNGIFRAVVEEAVWFFDSTREAEALLKGNYLKNTAKVVWNDRGLVVGYCIDPARHQVSIETFQILINGKIPTNFPGARNNLFSPSTPLTTVQ